MEHAARVVEGALRAFDAKGAPVEPAAMVRVRLDAAGQPIDEERLSSEGRVVLRRRFGPGSRLLEEQAFRIDGLIDHRTQYQYDASGRRIEEQLYLGDGALHGKWIDSYGEGARLTRRAFYNRQGALDVTETHTWSADGRRDTVIRGSVAQWLLDYDAAGKLVQKKGGPISGDEGDQEWMACEYDDHGRLLREVTKRFDGSVERELVLRY